MDMFVIRGGKAPAGGGRGGGGQKNPGVARAAAAATLVTHGDADQVVPVGDAYALFAALPEPKALAITPACDHRYSDPAHLDALIDRIVDWMVSRLPLGSSA